MPHQNKYYNRELTICKKTIELLFKNQKNRLKHKKMNLKNQIKQIITSMLKLKFKQQHK